ncbi:MAG TPA: class I SAM-dependent methyltransferase [Roseiflexaceae bacterium]|nr:class I SAM-dependent methyltransferase [Roseiflexaceae bacterium]
MTETQITSATYDQIAADYAARSPGADPNTLATIRQRFTALLAPGARVLDVGCGPGWEGAFLRDLGLRAYGLDRSRGMLAEARGLRLPLMLADMRALPLPGSSLDGLWASASFLHIPKRDGPAVLREFCRVLRQGGALYIGVKEGDGERWVEQRPGHQRFFAFYQPEELDALLAAHGFAVIERWLDTDSLGRPERWINRIATLKSR